MIQDPSRDVTLIVYNTPAPPKYIKINKRLIRILLMVVPTLVIVFLTASFVYSVFLKNRVSELKSLEPATLKKLELQRTSYEAKLLSLRKTNTELTNKLSRGSVTSETTASLLSLFSIPTGANDLRSKNLLTLEEIQLKSDSKNIKLTFNMNNNTSEGTKLSGYMTVVQYQGSILQLFPESELNEKNLKLEYANGEYYSFSRLRPTEVKFAKHTLTSARYKIFLFSRTGDLIFYQQLGPFNIE